MRMCRRQDFGVELAYGLRGRNYMKELEQRVKNIEYRNRLVEGDKAWETSWVRRSLLVVFTYFTIGIYLWTIDVEKPWLNAVIPAVAFTLSTLTMPFFKSIWMKSRWRDKSKDI
jgi:hypothetical protein